MAERCELIQWLRQIIDNTEVPRDVFFKTAHLFDRYLEADYVIRRAAPLAASSVAGGRAVSSGGSARKQNKPEPG